MVGLKRLVNEPRPGHRLDHPAHPPRRSPRFDPWRDQRSRQPMVARRRGLHELGGSPAAQGRVRPRAPRRWRYDGRPSHPGLEALDGLDRPLGGQGKAQQWQLDQQQGQPGRTRSRRRPSSPFPDPACAARQARGGRRRRAGSGPWQPRTWPEASPCPVSCASAEAPSSPSSPVVSRAGVGLGRADPTERPARTPARARPRPGQPPG